MNPCSETTTSIFRVLLHLCPADQALRGGTHLCPAQPWWLEAVCAPYAAHGLDSRTWGPTTGGQNWPFRVRSRPGAWAVHGGGAGEVVPVRRAQGDLTELACNGPLLARRTVPSPATKSALRIFADFQSPPRGFMSLTRHLLERESILTNGG